MTRAWIEIEHRGRSERRELASGRTRVGAAGCDVELELAGGEELHFWSDPPAVVHAGGATVPRIGGQSFEECPLRDGDVIEWGAARIAFSREPDVIEEEFPEAPAAPAAGGLDEAGPEARILRRLLAGMLVELGLADKREARRWQEAVRRGEHDPDACARDLLAASGPATGDPRLLERAARLQRDLLMAPLLRGARGAARGVRRAGKSFVAMVLAQLVALAAYTLILLAVYVLVRLEYGWSLDERLERWIPALGRDAGAGGAALPPPPR